MKTLDNYPIGADTDPRAPYNEPLPIKVKAEVGVELGLFVDIEVSDESEVEDKIKEIIRNKFKSKDIEVNNITVYQYDILGK